MAEEAINAWLDGILRSAAVMEAYIDRQELDDSFGWGALLDAMWFSEDGKRLTGSGVLLTGPDGSGKHTAAYHMIKGLLRRKYTHVFLTDEDFDAKTGAAELAKERLQGLLDRFYDQEQALCIVLEQAETFQSIQSVLRLLGEALCEYWLCEDYPPLFVILIASDNPPIPAPLRGRLRLCRMSLPGEVRRRAFLENKAEDLRHYVPFNTLLSQTEGMSYAELSDVVGNIRTLVDQTDSALSEEQVAAFVRGQKPQPIRVQAPEKVEALIDALPQLLTDFASKINTGRREVGPVPDSIPHPVSGSKQEDPAGEWERIENLPVSDLAEELFGKERVAQMLQQIQTDMGQ